MIRKAAARLLSSLVVLWIVITAAFLFQHLLPSDAARAIAGPQARPADVEKIRVSLGLDRPLRVRYGLYLGRMIHLGPREFGPKDPVHRSCSNLGAVHVDFGLSFQRRQPVVKLILERLPRSVVFAILAVSLQVIIGGVAGVIAAMRRGRWQDHGTILLTLLGISTPTFISGLVLQYWLAHKWRILPLSSWGPTFQEQAVGIILPVMTLGIFGASFYARFVRDEMLGQLHQDYIRTARAKGLSKTRVALLHGLRNALMPLVTVIGMDFGTLVGGAIVTEKLFGWPGLGALSVDAVVDRDTPVVVGIVIVVALSVLITNMVVDAAYAFLDPRTRRSDAADSAA